MSVSTDANQKEPKLGAFPFVLAGLSFIPLLGILFGIAAVTWGRNMGSE